MKAKLLFVVFIVGLFTTSSWSQTLELWSTSSAGFDGVSHGCIYKTDANANNMEVVYNFYSNDGGLNGYSPSAGLVQATNKKLYGNCFAGGENDCGVIFEYDPANNTFTKKYDFVETEGKKPRTSMIQASNGRLYGVAEKGGISDWGTLFEYDIENDQYIVIHYFNSSDGRWPNGVLLQANNGKLYGCANAGGAMGFGVLFEFDLENNEYNLIESFNEAANGKGPTGNLIQANNGKIYGTATVGGDYYNGVIFEYNIEEDSLKKVFDFNWAEDGRYPIGGLLQLADGSLIGLTREGGDDNLAGIIYSFNINNHSLTKLVNLNDAVRNPRTGFFQASNNKLYAAYTGTTYHGGIFEYDIENEEATIKVPGGLPYSKWIEIEGNNDAIDESVLKNNIKLYPNPTNGLAILEFDKNIKVLQVNIWNMEGKLLRNYQDITSQKLTLDITGNGIYMVEIITKESKTVLKFIKE